MKGNKGITLVALIITIIVMLILAGVSINLVIGENGVLTQARNAAEQQKYASAKEMVLMSQEMVVEGTNAGKVNLSKTLENIEDNNIDGVDGSMIVTEEENYAILVLLDNQEVIIIPGVLDPDDDNTYGSVSDAAEFAGITDTDFVELITEKVKILRKPDAYTGEEYGDYKPNDPHHASTQVVSNDH